MTLKNHKKLSVLLTQQGIFPEKLGKSNTLTPTKNVLFAELDYLNTESPVSLNACCGNSGCTCNASCKFEEDIIPEILPSFQI
ncbi:MAG: hypothetical protein Tsb005_21470 [Gammaproteobacteria bacterium]